ncbi:AMP-binding protein [Thermophagus xiamenensis]|uniref:Long-chain acyl-CoA synthetase n=1 Tax=Thermophagus xiamenensis TaxID=385682 RepID=A0A1I1ZYT1_9BACT|nr:AMP-binding protein [Thermophagus xiamenensis]SFE36825.1 long-chain acyl-CoA synthetase [Thermophagus xiamenensis]
MGRKAAIIYGNDSISYSGLLKHIGQYAASFKIEKSGTAALFFENRPEWVYSFYAIWKNQGIPVPIDHLATADEVAYILNDCRPEIVFTSKNNRETLLKAIEIAGLTTQIIDVDSLSNENRSGAPQYHFPKPEATDTAVIIYTSGTTGSPKGVMLSFDNLLANIEGVAHKIKIYSHETRTMMLLPLHHIFPLMGTMIIPLYVGGTISICPSMASEEILSTLRNSKINLLIGVPRLYSAIGKGIRDKIDANKIAKFLFRLSSKINNKRFSRLIFSSLHKKMGGALTYLVSGGAALDPEVAQVFKTLGFEVLEGYGMTESAPMITFTRPGRFKSGSPGEALPGTKIEIIDGEITASGRQIMKGYYNRPEETAEVLKDGRLHTGDLGYLSEEGFLFITGRKKEIIVLSNGKNVNPAGLEQKIETSPLVRECGVFFKDDMLQAIIVPEKSALMEAGETDNLEDIIRWEVIDTYNKEVSSYKKIMRFYLTDQELPRTRLSKLQRYKLKDLVRDTGETREKTSAPEFEEYKMIASYLSKEKNRTVSPHHHIEMDLGLDSLDKVAFQTYLDQTFGVKMEPTEMLKFNNILLLSEHIRTVKTKITEQKINWKEILKEKVHINLPKTWITGSLFVRLSKFFFHIYFRFRAKGVKNIPEGPCIITPNHQSFFDGLFVASYLKSRQLRKTYFYAKEKHIRQRWLKFLANRNNIIIMDLNKDLKTSIQKMAEVLKRNRNLIIFPEGTRSKSGHLGPFKKTFAILSRELNVPIVPVSIKGAHKALPKGSKFPKPFKKVDVEFLEPIYPGKESYETLTVKVKNKIQYKINEPGFPR